MKYPKTRLSLLMFIQFFIWGATGPVLSLYLRDCLHFTGTQIGLVLGISAISAIVSPTLMAFVADRLISSERLLCLLNAAAGAFMIVFSAQTEFYPALAACVAFHIAMNPAVPLINAITFHHAPTDRRKFGNIRVWGTVGWIAVAWTFSFTVAAGGNMPGDGAAPGGGSHLPLLLKISAATSFIMAAYSLTIPKRNPKKRALSEDGKTLSSSDEIKPDGTRPTGADGLSSYSGPKDKPAFFPAGAFKIIMKPQVLLLSFVGAGYTFVDKFYSVGAAPFLRQIGFSEGAVMPAMSLGQVPEIAAMAILGYLLRRCGVKAVLLAGMALAAFRYGVYAAVPGKALIYAGLSVHGLAYTFTMVTAVICLDGFCGERDRTGVHQLYAVLTGGVGGFLGSYAAGLVADRFAGAAGTVDYGAYWTVPLVISAIIFVTILAAWPSKCSEQ